MYGIKYIGYICNHQNNAPSRLSPLEHSVCCGSLMITYNI